jgi:hypothetical protein
MGVKATYLQGEYGAAARRWGAEALSGLGVETSYDLEIRGVGNLPPGAIGSADRDCVYLTQEAFTNGRTSKQRDDYLGFIIFEEVAHHLLEKGGVPGGATGPLPALIQETFATWYQMQATSISVEYITFPPIPTSGGLYEVGNYLGASLAGLSEAGSRLDAWLLDPTVDESEKNLVRELQKRLSTPLTVAEMATIYEELKG